MPEGKASTTQWFLLPGCTDPSTSPTGTGAHHTSPQTPCMAPRTHLEPQADTAGQTCVCGDGGYWDAELFIRRWIKKSEWLSYLLRFCSRGRETATRFPNPPRSLRLPGGTLSYWPIVLSLQSSPPPSCPLWRLVLILSKAVRTIFYAFPFSPALAVGRPSYSSVSQYGFSGK